MSNSCGEELGNSMLTIVCSPSTTKNPDDVVITLAIRTPLAKGKKGGFKDTDLDYMVYALLKKVIEKSKIDPNLVEDICMGNVR
jgi:acetyl-CoA acyltransferase 1